MGLHNTLPHHRRRGEPRVRSLPPLLVGIAILTLGNRTFLGNRVGCLFRPFGRTEEPQKGFKQRVCLQFEWSASQRTPSFDRNCRLQRSTILLMVELKASWGCVACFVVLWSLTNPNHWSLEETSRAQSAKTVFVFLHFCTSIGTPDATSLGLVRTAFKTARSGVRGVCLGRQSVLAVPDWSCLGDE